MVEQYPELELRCIRFHLNSRQDIFELMNPSHPLREGNKVIPNVKALDGATQNQSQSYNRQVLSGSKEQSILCSRVGGSSARVFLVAPCAISRHLCSSFVCLLLGSTNTVGGTWNGVYNILDCTLWDSFHKY